MTTYEYDDQGRVERSITVRESEFSSWDRAALLTDLSDSKVRRGAHGLPLSETTNPENQFAYDVPRSALGVPAPVTDWAQKALDEAQEQYRKLYPDTPLGSKLWRVMRRDSGVLNDATD